MLRQEFVPVQDAYVLELSGQRGHRASQQELVTNYDDRVSC